MEENKETVTIRVSQEFKDWLEKQGSKADTYEDILRRLTSYPNHKGQK